MFVLFVVANGSGWEKVNNFVLFREEDDDVEAYASNYDDNGGGGVDVSGADDRAEVVGRIFSFFAT